MCPPCSFLKSNSVFTVENTQRLRDDELRREYYEEQRNEFENFVEEQRDGKSSPAALLREESTVSKARLAPMFP